MTQKKRWGSYIDTRNHKKVHEELLKKYEIYVDIDWIASWDSELEELNRNKRGAPYQYPPSMIKWQAFLVEKFSTRGAEAITRKMESYQLIPKCNDHATIHRRVLAMDLKFEIPKGVKLHVGTDGSGFKQTYSGEYFQTKYGKERRKFVRVTITATKDEILDVDVQVNEKGMITEPNSAQNHIENILEQGGEVEKVYNDGAFDTKKFFNFLGKHDIDSAIRIRSNASKNARGSMRRKKEVFFFKKHTLAEWSKMKQYGHRWPMTEGKFSAVKRIFGDCANAKHKEKVLVELKRKFWLYNELNKYGKMA